MSLTENPQETMSDGQLSYGLLGSIQLSTFGSSGLGEWRLGEWNHIVGRAVPLRSYKLLQVIPEEVGRLTI